MSMRTERPPTTGDPVRTVLVGDRGPAGSRLRLALERQPCVHVVGEAVGGSSALRIVEEAGAEVVVLHLRTDGPDGVECCRRLRERFPHVKVIVLSACEDGPRVLAALQAGARGYLLGDAIGTGLAEVIVAVRDGEVVIDPALTADPERNPPATDAARFGLSAREAEVLGLVSRGLSNLEVGRRLFITEQTVKSHMRSILRKLHVADRTQAVSLALRAGLVE